MAAPSACEAACANIDSVMGAYSDLLRSGRRRVGIWGLGYIGYSSMAHFARSGVACVGYDIDSEKVRNVGRGISAIPNMEYWLGFDVAPLAEQGLMSTTEDPKELISADTLVHLICVPTEKDARPFNEPLGATAELLANYAAVDADEPPLVVVESTVAPTVVDEVLIPILQEAGLIVGTDIFVGVAPRRDWFISPDKSLRTLPRVVGGTTEETSELMEQVLRLVCDVVLLAPDHRHAALIKSIENAYRQVEIALANQLSLAYPDFDMLEILRLVGTKWNIGTYQPSFGTGGYCIPLAPHYVRAGAHVPQALTILEASVRSEEEMPRRVARSVISKFRPNKIGIAGLAYKGDIKVAILSPTRRMIEEFKDQGLEVKVNDPYYSSDELRAIAGVESFEFPQGLGEFDTVLVVADHLAYRSIPADRLRHALASCRVIVDNVGVWQDIQFPSLDYYRAGTGGWLGSHDDG